MFEITIVQRNGLGEPIENQYGGIRRKHFTANSGAELATIWQRNGPQPTKKNKKKRGKNDKN